MESIHQDRPVPEWFKPLNRSAVERRSRDLPHWQHSEGTYFVTFRMADSIARETQEKWNKLRISWLEKHPRPWDCATYDAFRGKITEKMEDLLDQGYGSCVLRDPLKRKIVFDALMFFEGERHRTDSLIIMPNHVHVIVQPIGPWRLSKILHSWKSYTAHRLCREYELMAPFWLDESFDHLVRSGYYLRKYREYILENPLKAHLNPLEYSLWCK